MISGRAGRGGLRRHFIEVKEGFRFFLIRLEREGRKSLAFRLSFRAPDRTLTEGEADEAFGRIVKTLADSFGATLRSG